MTITRETLELAALAGGLSIQEAHDGYLTIRMDDFKSGYSWRPHTDIADAARLAVRLCIRVSVGPIGVLAQPEQAGDVLLTHDGTQTDKERAYCEAVTLCVAGIGRRMKGGAV